MKLKNKKMTWFYFETREMETGQILIFWFYVKKWKPHNKMHFYTQWNSTVEPFIAAALRIIESG